MRNIKFRGIHKGEWVYGSYVTDNKTYFAIVSENPHDECEMINQHVDVESVGQSTGLQDKNGVDIYEGDIWSRGMFIATVEFTNSGWQLIMAPSSDAYQYPYFNSNAVLGEVIGNIHQSPELLEQ